MHALARWSAGLFSGGGRGLRLDSLTSAQRVLQLRPLLTLRSDEPANGSGILSMLRFRAMSTDSDASSESHTPPAARVRPARSEEWPDDSTRMHDPEPVEQVGALLDELRSGAVYLQVQWTPDQAEQFRALATNLTARAATGEYVWIDVWNQTPGEVLRGRRIRPVASMEDVERVQPTVSQMGAPERYNRVQARVERTSSREVLGETLQRLSAGLNEAAVPVTVMIALWLENPSSE
jgi:hypothetical protein